MQTLNGIERVVVPHHELPYEQRPITDFKHFDWSKATKWDCVSFARAAGFKETGMSVNEVALLYDLLEKKKPDTIVELGRNYGTSTRLFMAHILKGDDAMLDSWDLKHWDGSIETMKENGYGFDRWDGETAAILEAEDAEGKIDALGVILRTAHSIKTPIPKNLEKGVDFLLIDTEHAIENCLPEYCRWREYLRSGAIIAFHDSTLPAVARGIEMIIEMEQSSRPGRIIRTYENERVDGFGIMALEWVG